jgi:RNA polymerase sigma-70 factor (ECF subfamily)
MIVHHNVDLMSPPAGKNPASPGDTTPSPAMIGAVDDDAADLATARAGDHQAFARLYDRHSPVVLSLCRGWLCGSLTEAEDAMQETFIRAHRLLERLHDAAQLRPWLYAIARRVCSERRRSISRRRQHEHAARIEATGSHDPDPTAPQAAQHSETLDRLTDAIEQLDDRQRLAVHLYYLDADPVRAAAASLGLSRSAYYKLLARARRRLAVLMREVQPS